MAELIATDIFPLIDHAASVIRSAAKSGPNIELKGSVGKISQLSPFATIYVTINPIGAGREEIGKITFCDIGIVYQDKGGRKGESFGWSNSPEENLQVVAKAATKIRDIASEIAGRRAITHALRRNDHSPLIGLHLQ